MNLEVNKKYILKYTEQFCFISNLEKEKEFRKKQIIHNCIFVGIISTTYGERSIFFSEDIMAYIMFSTENLSYVLDEKQSKIEKIRDQIQNLEDEIKKLESGKD